MNLNSDKNPYFDYFNGSYIKGDEDFFFPDGDMPEWTMGCFNLDFIPPYGLPGLNPLPFSFLLLILQILASTLLLRFFIFILKPLRSPRIVAEILTGVVLGPTLLGKIKGPEEICGVNENCSYMTLLFPSRSISVLQTMANMGLLFYLFMIGIEIDVSIIMRTGRKAMYIAATCMGASFLSSYAIINTFHMLMLEGQGGDKQQLGQIIVLAMSFSVTAFPVVARVLTENKLLNSELGRIAMSSALIIDVFSWVPLMFALPITDARAVQYNHTSTNFGPYLNSFTTLGYGLLSVMLFRPGIKWMLRHNPDNLSKLISLLLVGVIACSALCDLVGVHAAFGALVFGLIIPRGPLTVALFERLEDIVPGIFLPLFFTRTGLRVDFSLLNWNMKLNDINLLMVVMGCFTIKVVAVFVVASFQKMPLHDGFALGFLMNTKGVVQVIILNIARDIQLLNQLEFTIMMLATILITGIISPLVTFIYKYARGFISYRHRTVQQLSKGNIELRVLACVHNPRQVPGIINLLEISQPTQHSPVGVYALHLVELTGRDSAMLIVHNNGMTGFTDATGTQTVYEQIINSFENYERCSNEVYVQTLTTISFYTSIHVDICNQAEENRTALIIIPFHKHQTIDGGMEITNPAYRGINQNVLANAPCSVGILIDRGFSSVARQGDLSHYIVMLFFGGPDDREALTYARRMAQRPDISLTVIRFLPGELTKPTMADEYDQSTTLTVDTNTESEKQADDDYIRKFRMKTTGDDSIVYTEKIVNNVNDTVQVIRSINKIHDFYIVGRGQGTIGEITAGLVDWCECPELGGVGDLLATSEFKHVSVLVVQQYSGAGAFLGDGASTPSSDQNSTVHLRLAV